MIPAEPVVLPGTHHPLALEGNIVPRPIGYDPADPACLSRIDDELLVFRTTAPVDVVAAYVAVDDGVADGRHSATGYPMTKIGAAGTVSLWECVVRPTTAQLDYTLAFELANGGAMYWGTTGLTTGIERLERFGLRVDDVVHHDLPDWARGMVLYQIFPDRFASGDDSLTPDDAEPWVAPPTRTGFKGGDLVGIRKQLDYLEELGVDAIYLNPIFTSPSNHKYDAADYYTVDPALGGNEALDELVADAHSRTMKVILDVSLNHAHPNFAPFADVIARGAASEFADWFIVNEWPVRLKVRPPELQTEQSPLWTEQIPRIEAETDLVVEHAADPGPAVEPTYDAWFGVPTMPRIELQNPQARQAMIDVAVHWVAAHDIDGWRMDVVRYIDPDFWSDLRSQVRAVRSDTYLLAEVMGDSHQWLLGDKFDATMNYTFRQLCLDYFATEAIDTTEMLDGLLRMLAMYSPAVTAVNHNLIGSHDTARFLTLAEGDTSRLLLATALQLTIPGAPGLYYGDEIAMEGGVDPDNRGAFDWARVGSEHHAAVRSLVRLRRERSALQHGDIRFVDSDEIVFQRSDAVESVTVVINRGASAMATTSGPVLWSCGTVEYAAGTLTVGPGSAAVAVTPT